MVEIDKLTSELKDVCTKIVRFQNIKQSGITIDGVTIPWTDDQKVLIKEEIERLRSRKQAILDELATI